MLPCGNKKEGARASKEMGGGQFREGTCGTKLRGGRPKQRGAKTQRREETEKRKRSGKEKP